MIATPAPCLLALLASALPPQDRPTARCPEVLAPITIDGSLDDWEGARAIRVDSPAQVLLLEGSALGRSWGGPADCSAVLHFAYDRSDLFLAGEVRDDAHVEDPASWWNGDAIEVFLRLSPEAAAEPAPKPADLQIFLMPLCARRPWGVGLHGGRIFPGDGGFVGMRVAGKPLAGGGGYNFEAAIPLVNLPGFEPGGDPIGLNVAIDDADDPAAGTKSYLVWFNPGPPPVEDMRVRGSLRSVRRLELPPLGAAPSRLLQDLGFAGGVLLLLVGLFALAGRLLRSARPRGPAVAALLALVVLSVPAARWAVRTLEASKGRAFEANLRAVERALAAAAAGEIGSLEGSAGPTGVLALLRGETIVPRPRSQFSFPPAPASVAADLVLGGEVPFRLYRLPLGEGTPLAVELLPPRPAGAVHFALTGEIPSGRLSPARKVSARLEYADSSAEKFDLELGRGEGKARFGASARSSEIFLRVLDGARRLARMEFEAPAGAPVTLEAVTLSFRDGYDPLPLGCPTASGVPTRIRGPHPGKGLELVPGEGPREWDLGAKEAERLFVVYGERLDGRSRALAFRGYGLPIVRGIVEFEDGPPVRFELKHGVDVHAADLSRSRHPSDPGRTADIAFVWEEGGEERHLDVRSVDLEGRRTARRLLLQNVAGGEDAYRVEVREVVLATSASVPDPAPGSPVALVPGGRRLGGAILEEFAGLRFGFVDSLGRSVPGQPREALLRASPEEVRDLFASGAARKAELRAEQEVWRGLLPLREGTRPVGAIAVARREPRASLWRRLAAAGPAALGFLAAPFLIVAAAERLARGRRLRVKLAGAFVLTSVAPLLVFAFGLADLYGRREERTAEESLAAEARAARDRIAIGVEEIDRAAARFAATFLSDPRVLETARSPDGPDLRERWREVAARARHAVMGDEPGSFVRIEVVDTGAQPSPARFVVAEGEGALPLENAEIPVSDLFRLWGRHLRAGVHRAREGDRTFIFVVGAPPLPASLADSGIGVFSKEGLPVAPDRFVEGEDRSPSRAAAVRALAERAAREGEPACGGGESPGPARRMAVDVLRDREGRAIASVAAFAPLVEPGWNLGFLRIRTRGGAFALAAAFVVAALVVARILTARIVRPLERLESGARALERGEARLVEAESGDEVGRLTRTFNAMAEELRRRLHHLSALNRAFGDLASRLDLEGVATEAGRLFREQGGAARVLIAVREPEGGPGLLLFAGGSGASVPMRRGFLRAAVDAGEILTLADDRDDALSWMPGPEGRALRGSRGVIAVPLRVGERSLGAAILGFPSGIPAQRDFLLAAAAQVSVALENARLYRLALEDPSTGILHAAAFRRRMAEEIERAPAGPVSVVKFAVPGSRGRAADADPLVAAARALRRATRGIFPAGRTRADELALILPGVDRRRASRFAERARRAIARSLGEADPREGARRIAAAVAAFPDDAASGDFLLHEVDRALRRVRDSGGAVAAPRDRDRQVPEEGDGVVARADAMEDLLFTVERIAPSDLPVLIQGETGAGKEVLADEIHRRSHRRDGPYVKVNCAAIPEALLESELFGHERGAFTGAERRRLGRFELASGGSLFLDEIGELPPAVQAKLLRVLQERQVVRLGGESAVPVDVRVIAATNRDLRKAVSEGSFRTDLFYRLNAVSLLVPPLRERREDIPPLVRLAIRRASERDGTRITGLSAEAFDRLYGHAWPGNVRELFNVVGRACVLKKEGTVGPEDLPLEFSERAQRASAGTVRARAGADLNPRQAALLGHLKTKGWITTREYIETSGTSVRTGLRDLSDLVRKGYVIRVGKRRGAVYRLASARGAETA